MPSFEDDEVILTTVPQRPLFLTACWRTAAHRLFGLAAPPWTVNWSETIFEMFARFLWGLFVGAGLCVLLFPIVFWPNRRSRKPERPSLYDNLGQPNWVGWIFIAAVAVTCCFFVLSTRAVVRFRKPTPADVSPVPTDPT